MIDTKMSENKQVRLTDSDFAQAIYEKEKAIMTMKKIINGMAKDIEKKDMVIKELSDKNNITYCHS